MKKKFLLCTPGTFHYFDLAKALHKSKQLTKIVSGYPLYKLKKYNLPKGVIKSFGLYQIVIRFLFKFKINVSNGLLKKLNMKNFLKLDKISSKYIPQSDIFFSTVRNWIKHRYPIQRKK